MKRVYVYLASFKIDDVVEKTVFTKIPKSIELERLIKNSSTQSNSSNKIKDTGIIEKINANSWYWKFSIDNFLYETVKIKVERINIIDN